MGSVTGGANAGDTDVVVAKFSPAGQQVWTKQFGSTNFDYGFGIAVDVWGTIAVVGETQGQFPGMRETGITDAFVASLRSDGTIRWLRQEDSGPDFAYNNFTSVVMDDYENIIVGGSTGGSYTEDTVVSGPLDAVVVAYNKFSARMWVRQFGTTSRDEVLSLSRAPSGDIFAVGNTRGRVFGYLGPVGATDAFIVKLSKSGVLTWLKQYGTTQVDQLLSVDSDASGKVVAAGYTKGALTPGMTPRDEDAVMMKWSAFDPVPRPSSTWATGKNVRQSVLLQLGNLTSPYGSTVKLAISGASRRNCSVVGSSIRTMRRGTCRLTISVTNISGVIRRTTVALTIV
jgi:hypothetical protein